jgi:hypothetical protein
MYRFSRSIYRELYPHMLEQNGNTARARQEVLEACESAMQRLAYDRRYFARPSRTLFNDVRTHFSMHEQLYVYKVIDRYVNLALDHLAQLPEHGLDLDGRPRMCLANTRKGTPCQREPLPGRDYCPSHKHLEEPQEAFDEVGAAA